MSHKRMIPIFVLLFVTHSAVANILVWEGQASDCTISDVYNTITINEPGTYGFRAWNGDNGSPALQNIQKLDINGSVTGQVTVKIAYDSGGAAGATYIETMTLTSSTPVKLAMLNISGDLGTEDDVEIDVLDGPLTARVPHPSRVGD